MFVKLPRRPSAARRAQRGDVRGADREREAGELSDVVRAVRAADHRGGTACIGICPPGPFGGGPAVTIRSGNTASVETLPARRSTAACCHPRPWRPRRTGCRALRTGWSPRPAAVRVLAALVGGQVGERTHPRPLGLGRDDGAEQAAAVAELERSARLPPRPTWSHRTSRRTAKRRADRRRRNRRRPASDGRPPTSSSGATPCPRPPTGPGEWRAADPGDRRREAEALLLRRVLGGMEHGARPPRPASATRRPPLCASRHPTGVVQAARDDCDPGRLFSARRCPPPVRRSRGHDARKHGRNNGECDGSYKTPGLVYKGRAMHATRPIAPAPRGTRQRGESGDT